MSLVSPLPPSSIDIPPQHPSSTTRDSLSSKKEGRRVSIAKSDKETFKERRVKSSKSTEMSSTKSEKSSLACGFASLKPGCDDESGGCWSEPVLTAMNNDDCEQLVGRGAEDYLETLSEYTKNTLRRNIGTGERREDEYFMWMRKEGRKMAVISVKCVENFLSGQSGRRVKWRNVSTGRLSIYRYSIAVIPVGFGTRVSRSIRKHRKLCLILVWLVFVGLICLTVVLGSVGSEGNETSTGMPNTRIG